MQISKIIAPSGAEKSRKKRVLFVIFFFLIFTLSFSVSASLAQLEPLPDTEILVYGGTAAGVIAAVAASRHHHQVIILSTDSFLGGMVSSGLSATDEGKNRYIGGLSREFFERVGQKYQKSIEWNFEPKVATQVFQELVREQRIKVILNTTVTGVEKAGTNITGLRLADGKILRAKVFIDASYEGDLLFLAGVPSRIGREGKSEYGESLAGFQQERSEDQFLVPVNGFGQDASPLSGLSVKKELPLPGAADNEVMAYNYRLCVTPNPALRVPFPEPRSYDVREFELLLRYFDGLPPLAIEHLFNFLPLPNNKFDLNNRGPFSTDFIGASKEFPAASPAARQEIAARHKDYMLGLWKTLKENPRVPERIREATKVWGLCKDEFVQTNNWPPQLYVREARRMIGSFVLSERDIRSERSKPDSIGVGTHQIESHHVQRFLLRDGTVRNEGFLYPRADGQVPYEIPYRSILPQAKDATNLLVPVCLSATHIALSAIRMEPVYMLLGHASGVAASLALSRGVDVHAVSVKELQTVLQKEKQVVFGKDKRQESEKSRAVSF